MMNYNHDLWTRDRGWKVCEADMAHSFEFVSMSCLGVFKHQVVIRFIIDIIIIIIIIISSESWSFLIFHIITHYCLKFLK